MAIRACTHHVSRLTYHVSRPEHLPQHQRVHHLLHRRAIIREDRPAGRRLRKARDLDGRRLEVVTLPMPAPLFFRGQRLPASYANFYLCNAAVLVPTFDDPADRVALGVLAELVRDRPVVGIHALDLVWGLGTLHCLTQQEPARPARVHPVAAAG